MSRTLLKTQEQFAEHFWARVNKTDTCWLWTGKTRHGSHGYGGAYLPHCVRPAHTVVTGAHRVAFFLTHGRWPELSRHTCDTPLCCRPDHIIEGTQLQNIHDALMRGRMRNGTTKLTPQQWVEIRTSSEDSRVLAARYGVHRNHVYNIRSGTYGHGYRQS